MARPFLKLPRGAKRHLEGMAQDGLLSESAAARALGMSLDNFRHVITHHLPSKEIWDNALAVERDALLDALYCRAADGDVKAAQTLLAIRHGLSEKQPQGGSGGVSITFNLPPAKDPKEYMKAIEIREQKSKELNHATKEEPAGETEGR